MAYANRVKRLTFSGTCFGTREIWSTGLFIADPGADVGTATQTEVDLYAARWAILFGLAGNKFSSAYTTTQTKLSVLDTAGHPDPLNTVYNTALVTTGAYGGNPQVPQASLVASLRATAIHGLATHGRMYLPGLGFVVDPSTGGISSGDQGTIATAFQTFVNGINSDAPVSEVVSLCSKGTTLPTVQAGVSQAVTTIEVGNYYDTQRRRRNGFAEAYVSHTIP
jgi:hypothetical protein